MLSFLLFNFLNYRSALCEVFILLIMYESHLLAFMIQVYCSCSPTIVTVC